MNVFRVSLLLGCAGLLLVRVAHADKFGSGHDAGIRLQRMNGPPDAENFEEAEPAPKTPAPVAPKTVPAPAKPKPRATLPAAKPVTKKPSPTTTNNAPVPAFAPSDLQPLQQPVAPLRAQNPAPSPRRLPPEAPCPEVLTQFYLLFCAKLNQLIVDEPSSRAGLEGIQRGGSYRWSERVRAPLNSAMTGQTYQRVDFCRQPSTAADTYCTSQQNDLVTFSLEKHLQSLQGSMGDLIFANPQLSARGAGQLNELMNEISRVRSYASVQRALDEQQDKNRLLNRPLLNKLRF
jgi:hypothetical protein